MPRIFFRSDLEKAVEATRQMLLNEYDRYDNFGCIDERNFTPEQFFEKVVAYAKRKADASPLFDVADLKNEV